MLFFFIFNWFPPLPANIINFFSSLLNYFEKKLLFVRDWFFFFYKIKNPLRSNKLKFILKKKKKYIIFSFKHLSKNYMYFSLFKKVTLSFSTPIYINSLFTNLVNLYNKCAFKLSSPKFIYFAVCSVLMLTLFFFKKNVISFFKKFFTVLFVKFIRKKRRFRRKRRLKKYSLRRFFFKKKTHHRKYFWIKPKRLLLFKSFIYFYTLLWIRLKNSFKKRRRLRKYLFRKYLKKKKKFIKLRIFLKKLSKIFIIKSKQILLSLKLKKSYKNYYFPKLIKRKFNYKLYFTQKKKKYLNFIKFFSLFIAQFLENTLKNKFLIILKFTRNKRLNRALRYQHKKVSRFQRKIGNGFFLREMLFIIWLSFKSKDLLFLVLWIKRTMERIKWRKQKLFLIALRIILKKSLSPYFYHLRCYGYRCVIWGKIGVSGNSKTRNFVCKNKFYSLTTKTYKNIHEFTTINTHTGVLGLSFYLIY